jgi:hypothetical protein
VKPNSWKSLKASEVPNILAEGLWILPVYERTADRTKGGAGAGKVDGKEAFDYCVALGIPQGIAVYFAVDYDAPTSEFNNIEAYLRAAAAQMTGYKIGVYGSYSVVEEMAARGAAEFFWQTLAWSKGKISEHANVYQKQIDVTVNGIGVDWNDQFSYAGMWGEPIPAPTIIVEERDDDNMPIQAPDWVWGQMYNIIGDAYNKDLVGWEWCQKVLDRTMTSWEYAHILAVIESKKAGLNVDAKNDAWKKPEER